MKNKQENGVQHSLDVNVPSHWEVVPLEMVLDDIVGGGTPSKANPSYWEGSIPWLTIKDMRTHRPADAIDHITDAAVRESSTNVIPADTVIIATRIGLGKVIRVPYDAAINQDLKALINKPEIDKGYLEYWIISIADYLESIGSGTTVKGIRLEQLRSLPFPLAPREQQKRIVAEIEKQFSRLDEAVANLKRVKANLKRYKAAVLKAAVEGKLTEEWRKQHPDLEPASKLLERILTERRQKWEGRGEYKEPAAPDATDLPELPEGWIWTQIETVTDMMSGHAFKKAEYSKKGVRLFQIANVSFGYTKWDEIEYLPESYIEQWENLLLKEGDVLMALNRPLLSRELKIAKLGPNDAPAILYQRVGKFLFYFEDIADYFLIFMQSPYYINALESQLQGVNIPFINKGKLLSTPIPLPSSVREMVIVAEKVKAELSILNATELAVEKNMRRAERLRQSILSKAFSGGLINKEPN